MARFLDSSVFLHCYLKPTRELSSKERQIKDSASKILRRVEKGEKVFTSAVHVSETMNIIEARLGLPDALSLLETLLSMENVTILPVGRESYEAALLLSTRFSVSPNDGIAYVLARAHGVDGIYSFDRHFDSLPGLTRTTG